MRATSLALSLALLLAIIAGQSFLFDSTEARNAPAGAVISQTVFKNACAHSDLHVTRYVPADSNDGLPVVATWCG